MPDQARFLDFMDMIDGGGRGQMGDKFEGGGIFSALANLVATPYGSEDPTRRARREAAYRAAGLLAPEEEAVAAPAAPAVTRTKPTRDQLISARTAEMERQRGLEQDVFDPRGPNQMPPLTTAPAAPAVAPVTSDPRGFAPNTQPSMLTNAQKEAMLMAQPVAPMGFDPRQFDRGSQPSTLTPNQASTAKGILAKQQAAQAALPLGNPPQPPVSLQPSDAMPNVPFSNISPVPTMGAPSAMTMPSAPSPMLEAPQPANEDMIMFTKMMGSVPEGAGDLNMQEYRDYVLGGGRLPYLEYEKTKPEYIATQQLAQQYETFYMMPIEEQMRLINERADIIRRETPKPVPFTGPAF
jgi:hypothetical protein